MDALHLYDTAHAPARWLSAPRDPGNDFAACKRVAGRPCTTGRNSANARVDHSVFDLLFPRSLRARYGPTHVTYFVRNVTRRRTDKTSTLRAARSALFAISATLTAPHTRRLPRGTSPPFTVLPPPHRAAGGLQHIPDGDQGHDRRPPWRAHAYVAQDYVSFLFLWSSSFEGYGGAAAIARVTEYAWAVARGRNVAPYKRRPPSDTSSSLESRRGRGRAVRGPRRRGSRRPGRRAGTVELLGDGAPGPLISAILRHPGQAQSISSRSPTQRTSDPQSLRPAFGAWSGRMRGIWMQQRLPPGWRARKMASSEGNYPSSRIPRRFFSTASGTSLCVLCDCLMTTTASARLDGASARGGADPPRGWARRGVEKVADGKWRMGRGGRRSCGRPRRRPQPRPPDVARPVWSSRAHRDPAIRTSALLSGSTFAQFAAEIAADAAARRAAQSPSTSDSRSVRGASVAPAPPALQRRPARRSVTALAAEVDSSSRTARTRTGTP